MARLYVCDNCGAQCEGGPEKQGTVITDYPVPYYKEKGIIDWKKQDLCTGCLARVIKALDREKYTVVEWNRVKRPYTRNTKKSAANQESDE